MNGLFIKRLVFRGVAQFGRVRGLGPRCLRFKSELLDQLRPIQQSLLVKENYFKIFERFDSANRSCNFMLSWLNW